MNPMYYLSKSVTVLLVAGLCSIIQPVTIQAQMARKSPEEAVYFLTDKMLKTNPHMLINVKTGETYESAEGLPVTGDIQLMGHVTDWRYQNGVMNLALLKVADYFNDARCRDFVFKTYAFNFKYIDYFRKLYDDPGIQKPPMWQFFNFRYLDNCGTMGAALIETYMLTGKKNRDYLKTINRTADYISEKEFRLPDGTLCREYPRPGTVWADDLYMSVSFLARMGALSGDAKYFDDAVLQVKNFTKYLFDENKKIYNHAYFDNTGETNGAFWGRANGWVLMAQSELLSFLPADHPGREEVLKIHRAFIRGLAHFQSRNGLWHQLLDKEDSFLESSCSAMFTYSIAKAVNEGWIDPAYAQVAWRGWEGLYSNITEDAQVKDICVGTHVEVNLPFYYNRPVSVNDTHGLAATLMAGTEISRMSTSYGERTNPRKF